MYLLNYLHPKTGNVEYVSYTSSIELAQQWKNGNNDSIVYDYEELDFVDSEEKVEELRYKD